MSSTWAIVIGVVFMLFLVNAAVAYHYRSKQLRAIGQEPPSFFLFLFFPRPLANRIPVPRLLRVALGLVVFSGGALFVLVGDPRSIHDAWCILWICWLSSYRHAQQF